MNSTVFDDPEEITYQKLFFPHAISRLSEITARSGRFVHYTSSEVAMNIIRNRNIWMRNATTMNDFSEIEHGFKCLLHAWSAHAGGQRFKALLNQVDPTLANRVQARFDQGLPDIRTSTFITCLSEHLDAEDENGRLSMWRAYGGRSGVAMVLRLEPFLQSTDALNFYSSPVAYMSPDQFSQAFEEMVSGMEREHEYLRHKGPEFIIEATFNMFRFAVLCTKHPGFAEEKEWRIIYSPAIAMSDVIETEICSIRGIPQIIHKIPLIHDPERGLYGATIPRILDRLIIGPTEDRLAIYQALIALLTEAGVDNAFQRVVASGIPLRH
ncbi:DUF2971 domain-containing protein [Phenylobacterium sp.]|uniref:DUF2971 domain-containing protein n=1 Tax=Phenylobacterium sp. TaxID=1871053 RepID=UPI002736C256|nr:DUF2971 domain-containing protein [Phenylobacterium sp.]MDP3855151.1 DUF2971 domain-containing protein [Phenylobacterium sp.]